MGSETSVPHEYHSSSRVNDRSREDASVIVLDFAPMVLSTSSQMSFTDRVSLSLSDSCDTLVRE